MKDLRTARTARAGLSALVGAVVLLVFVAAPASAQQAQLHGWILSGTITVNDQSIPLPKGTVDGALDLGTGRLTTQMSLMPMLARLTVPGLIRATSDTTLSLEEAAPLNGQAGFAGSNVVLDASPAFLLHVLRARSAVPALNLDSDTCRSEVPFSLPLHYVGPLDFASGFRFSGTVSLPQYEDCGLSAVRLNQLLSGSGTYSVTLAPGPGSPDPLAGLGPSPAAAGDAPPAAGSPDPGSDAAMPDAATPEVVTPDAAMSQFPDLSGILDLLTDTQAPTLDVSVRRSQRVLALGGAAAVVRCDERCLVTATATVRVGGRSYKLLSTGDVAREGASRKVKVRLTDAARRQLRAALKRHRRAIVELGLRATDVSGNRSKLARATVTVLR